MNANLHEPKTPFSSPSFIDSFPNALPMAVSVAEAAKLTGVGRSTLYAEMAAGRLAFAKVRKRRLIPMDALLAWLHAATTEAE